MIKVRLMFLCRIINFMHNVGVFLSAQELPETYTQPALELVELLAQNNLTFVYGGCDKGLMKLAADVTREHKGKIIAICAEQFKSHFRSDFDEQFICPDILTCKKLLINKSDAIVVLPGGTGTIDEVSDAIEHKKLGLFLGPIIFLNTNNFWDGLISQYHKIETEKFINRPMSELFSVVNTPQEVIEILLKG